MSFRGLLDALQDHKVSVSVFIQRRACYGINSPVNLHYNVKLIPSEAVLA